MMNKTAKDIIIKLIDNNYIDGEEAYTLISALQSVTHYYSTVNSPIMWESSPKTDWTKYEVTCSNANSICDGYSVSSIK